MTDSCTLSATLAVVLVGVVGLMDDDDDDNGANCMSVVKQAMVAFLIGWGVS